MLVMASVLGADETMHWGETGEVDRKGIKNSVVVIIKEEETIEKRCNGPKKIC